MCSYNCTKYLVFFFNLLFWILGLIIIGIGAWAAADKNFLENLGFPMRQLDEETLQTVFRAIQMFAIALVILGAIVLVIGFFGCCGAIRENQCCLGIFFVLLFICFLITVAIGGLLMFFFLSSTDQNGPYKEAFIGMTDAVWEALGAEGKKDFENKYKCCGAKNDYDLTRANTYMCAGKDFDALKKAGFGNKGCMEYLLSEVKTNVIIAGCVILGIAVVEIIGMSMACLLCCGIKRAYAAV